MIKPEPANAKLLKIHEYFPSSLGRTIAKTSKINELIAHAVSAYF